MRYMIIVKATKDSEAGVMPTEAKMLEMAKYHEELQKAGVLVDASGLQATGKGWRIHYEGRNRTFVDGPFAETKELIAGYTIIQTKTRQEALDWSRRFPNPDLHDATVRRSRCGRCSNSRTSSRTRPWNVSAR